MGYKHTPSPKRKFSRTVQLPRSAKGPTFPYNEIKFVGLGGRLHGPTPPSWTWKTTFPHYNFWFLIRGEGKLRYLGKNYLLKPGSCFLFTPGSRASGRSTTNEPFLNFSIHFLPTTKALFPHKGLDRLLGHKTCRMNLFLELARHCHETYKRGDELGQHQARFAALQMLLQLWREAFEPMPQKEDEKIMEILSEEGRQGTCAIPDLARQVGLSASQFTRRVHRITGMAPREYLIRERIGHACGLLVETSRPLSDVAEALGYTDLSYFVRQFQAVMKTTPARFRRQSANHPVLS